MRHKVAIRIVIDGDLRFISHHDTMRLFERALSRAQVPVRFSEGFNPRPKLSLPLPRTVGVASEADLLLLELTEPVAPATVLTRLAEQMPCGVRLADAWAVVGERVLRPERVTYEVTLSAGGVSAVADAIGRIEAAQIWEIRRAAAGNKPSKAIDLKTYLVDASVREETLRWTVCYASSGTVRPAEFLSAVGLAPSDWLHRVRRTDVGWATDPVVDGTDLQA